ncbi:DUF1592 domain-containing protein [Tautonia marina]|uniref:DUF1592 domain-containing protein n=1 Tax=Tautonia marina TaxID=2653855 RepID=UPI0013756FEB|nr:DUF1592 domain-containing protein [Tautonia marina]
MRIPSNTEGLDRFVLSAGLLASLLASIGSAHAAGDEPLPQLATFLQRYCVECHGHEITEAHVNLEAMAAKPDFGPTFKEWEKVARVLLEGKMPPEYMPQPGTLRTETILRTITEGLDRYVEQNAGDPGPVAMRRLTSAEYAYTIRDLTGLDLNVADRFVSDAVSGEGFTNAGGAQFMQDSTLERYLEAAKIVSDHAVIGAGPLTFFRDPGQTGRELSAITRLQQLYRDHGFRAGAGEGAEPFGQDRYPAAMVVAWQYRFRDELGLGAFELPELARREGQSVRLCEHLWDILNREGMPSPLSEIINRWQSLPSPLDRNTEETRALIDEIAEDLREWQHTLAEATGDVEEAAVLSAGEVQLDREYSFLVPIQWPEKSRIARLEVSVSTVSDPPAEHGIVVWKNPRVQFRSRERRRGLPQPLRNSVTPETSQRLAFGQTPSGGSIGDNDFAIPAGATIPVDLQIPTGADSARLMVDVALLDTGNSAGVVRCRIADWDHGGAISAEVSGTSALLAVPEDPAVDEWQNGASAFARVLPSISHREPAPSDRDPIPEPFDNAYNTPERNHFHTAIKYHRDDHFFVNHIADDETRRRLDEAWADLLTSFDYYDRNLLFAIQKFSLNLDVSSISELDRKEIDRLAPEPAEFVRRLTDEFTMMQQALRDAEPGHVEDALRFAERAWRRPLTPDDRQRLRGFYSDLRSEGELDHDRAIRTLLARILVAPAFLYRVESVPSDQPGVVALSEGELANRLSYFLWSSIPDEELLQSAAEGRLKDPAELDRQARRMLRDPRARRLATEFFGQWLGFYRFDRYQGIDTDRFPEFSELLRASMYEEAISFFEHLVREDRPVDEILFADYSFLDRRLAEHYGVEVGSRSDDTFSRVDHLDRQHRGGLFGLGAVLTATSAPLRTSAVKRGDWVLRRVVGTPVPPPPADVGSIPADDVRGDGLTVRQRLEAHRSDASCINCHARIDPLGFALEQFDPLGRWRDSYRDGQPIDPSGTLADGTFVSGPDGLRAYLRRERSQFHRNFSTKLLGYALGRAELASDRPLIERMTDTLEHGGRISDLIVQIVSSEQFRNRRTDAILPPDRGEVGGE